MQPTNIASNSSPRTDGDEKSGNYEKDVWSRWSERRDAKLRSEPNLDRQDTNVPANVPAKPTANLGVVPYIPKPRPIPREIVVQEWEGRVEEIEGHFIIAKLVDITAKERQETEEVELPIDDVPEADQHLMQPGAIFRWILGYHYPYGRKEKFARVVVRRLPVWTEREMREADREADDLHNAIFGDSEARTAG